MTFLIIEIMKRMSDFERCYMKLMRIFNDEEKCMICKKSLNDKMFVDMWPKIGRSHIKCYENGYPFEKF